MNASQRHALEDVIRSAIGRDLDQFHAELHELRHQVALLQRKAGLPAGGAVPRGERQQRAAALREEGCSVRMIAATVGAHRNTVTADLRRLGVEPPAGQVVGLDGRQTQPRLAR